MNNRVCCTNLLKIINKFYNKESAIDLLASLLVYNELKCSGRTHLMKKLGISERSARKIIKKLLDMGVLMKRKYDTCINEEINSDFLLENSILKINDRVITVTSGFCSSILETLDKNIVSLRDYIVVLNNDPECIELIGYYNSEKQQFVFPRVPLDYTRKYEKELAKMKLNRDSIIVIWKKYRPYRSIATLLYGLYMICLKRIRGNK